MAICSKGKLGLAELVLIAGLMLMDVVGYLAVGGWVEHAVKVENFRSEAVRGTSLD